MNNIIVNISEAKTRLSKFSKLVKQGQTIILAERNIPFAQITPLAKTQDYLTDKRKSLFGSLKNAVKIVGDINAPLTEKELDQWYTSK